MRTAIQPLLPASAFKPRVAPPGIGSGKLRSVPSGCAVCPPILALHQSYCVVIYSQIAVSCTCLLLVWKGCTSSIVSSMYCRAF